MNIHLTKMPRHVEKERGGTGGQCLNLHALKYLEGTSKHRKSYSNIPRTSLWYLDLHEQMTFFLSFEWVNNLLRLISGEKDLVKKDLKDKIDKDLKDKIHKIKQVAAAIQLSATETIASVQIQRQY